MTSLVNIGRTVLLCLVGGSADAIAYLRYGTFVGAMTGNTVLLGIDLARARYDGALYHFGIIAVFLIAVILARLALLHQIPLFAPLVLTALMLGGSDFILSKWSAALSAAALGMQNAAVRKIGGVPVNTVFVTGDLLRLGSAVTEAGQPKQDAHIAVLTAAWGAYAAGAAFGAAMLYLTRYPMLVPGALALLAALVETGTGRRHAAA